MKSSDPRYADVRALQDIIIYLSNCGNDYSSIGIERNMMEQFDVDAAIDAAKKELDTILRSNIN